MPIEIPLLMAIEEMWHHDDSRIEHLLRVGVIGMDQPMTVEIESDFYKSPRIKEFWTCGGIDLPAPLEERFLFACFEELVPCLDGTDIAEWPLFDATDWIQNRFSSDDAQVLLQELGRHVRPGLEFNPQKVTAFLPVNLFSKNGESHGQ